MTVPTTKGSSTPSRVTLPILLSFVAIYLIWGSTYLAIMIGIETIPPFALAGIRFVIAGGLLYGFLLLRGAQRPSSANWKAATLLGGLMLLGGNGLVTWGEQYVASGLAAVLVTTMPLWLVALDATFYRGSRPNRWQVIGLLAGFVGVIILVDPRGSAVTPLGALAILLAAFSWANGSLLNRTANLPESPWMATATQMLAGGGLLLVTATLLGEWRRFDLGAISMRSFGALVFLIVFGSILAFSAFVYLMRVRPAAEVSTYAFVNPVIALALGWLVGEPFGMRAWAGSALIIGSVVLIHRAQQRPRRAGLKHPPKIEGVASACEGLQ